MNQIEWESDGLPRDMVIKPSYNFADIIFDLNGKQYGRDEEVSRIYSNLDLSTATEIIYALQQAVMQVNDNTFEVSVPPKVVQDWRPLVRECDPELERLLAEEEEVEQDHPVTASTVGELRALLASFTDECRLTNRVTARFSLNRLHGGSHVRLEERGN